MMPQKLLEPRWRERGPWHVIYAVSGLGLLINQRGDSLSSSLFSFLLLFFYRHLRAIWAIQGLVTWSSRYPNTTGLGASTARLALDSAENLHDIILHALRIIATAHPSGYST